MAGIEQSARGTCATCGVALQPSETVCPTCGSPVAGGAASAPRATSAAAQAPMQYGEPTQALGAYQAPMGGPAPPPVPGPVPQPTGYAPQPYAPQPPYGQAPYPQPGAYPHPGVYQQPGAYAAVPASSAWGVAPYASPWPAGIAAIAALSVGALLYLIVVFLDISVLGMLGRAAAGQPAAPGEGSAAEALGSLLMLGTSGMYLLTAILFLVWVYRAHQNLPALGARGLEFTPGWAVGWWFIPFLNLVRPYQVVSEIWHNSQPDPYQPRSHGLLGAWWGAFLVAGILGRVVSGMTAAAQTGSDRIASATTAVQMEMVSCILYILAGGLAIAVVRTICAMQVDRCQRQSMAASGAGVRSW